ncbi:hypothetical protein [Metabacillus halosaccharovorans]|uniref:Uncharacterized protein n=1 Tax=Metabacillus halosaccharovorans TaxID=930124 RepID=A0ABT3DIY9_9BACI|nr:hypothetical protein [Metabacillus halosaccharovorans]MCV9887017.1 hypothetical protein [Metabacillus halosaccharovorans]
MNFVMKKPIKLFDQIDKYKGIHNILGIGDPHVVKIQNQWWMFVGGFQTNFKNNIFTASLPVGDPLSSNNWSITTYEDREKKAKPLCENSQKGSWDFYGFHTPCYVSGIDQNGTVVERVYYTGRASNKVVDNQAPYSIGMLEKTVDGWNRYPSPILRGTKDSPNVLEPKIRYIAEKWRAWYVTTKQETGKNGYPNYTMMYAESDDGINNWSTPIPLFLENENFYDASVHKSNTNGYEMAVCRSTNLYGRSPFPMQGMWLLTGHKPNGDRANWSKNPLLILDAKEGEDWYKNGIGSPCGHYGESEDDQDTLYLFFTGLHGKRNWLQHEKNNIRKKKLPPFPSPFYFAIGKVELTKISEGKTKGVDYFL